MKTADTAVFLCEEIHDNDKAQRLTEPHSAMYKCFCRAVYRRQHLSQCRLKYSVIRRIINVQARIDHIQYERMH